MRKLWKNCEKVKRILWESGGKVVRKLWESCKKLVWKSTTLLQLQTLADMFVLVCFHSTSQNLDVPTGIRRPYDNGFAFQAKGHGNKAPSTELNIELKGTEKKHEKLNCNYGAFKIDCGNLITWLREAIWGENLLQLVHCPNKSTFFSPYSFSNDYTVVRNIEATLL